MDLKDRLFWIAKEDEIKKAETTDVYFIHTVNALRKSGTDPHVVMEVFARELPYQENWAIATGIYEVAKLLEGLPVNVMAMDEGEVFLASRGSAVYEPILQIEGKYTDIAIFETVILGLITSSTSVSTKAARLRLIAGDKLLFSFGTRRAHPALAPMIERATYIAGFDGVSNVLGARLIGRRPVGTMPHAFILSFEDQREAWKAFDRTLPEDLPRIALIDTLFDEKIEAIMALEALGKRLYGVRLDTPRSRRGDFRKIIEEVRWELNIRGGESVKIFASGAIDEDTIMKVRDLVDGFGIGTTVSNPPVIDFSMKIVQVELDGKVSFRAKRGDLGGKKQVYRDEESFEDTVTLALKQPPEKGKPLLTPLIENGKIVRNFKGIDEIRSSVLSKLNRLRSVQPRLKWS
ncbi:MAG: nicotinate phosphoribosyltransferase [Nitrososphaerota archaeon]|nr:nicotinate phosphoribosyltransferase [Nitrososphaerales archaeon]MDW8044222.1 nicotinate phosphoribosyltransferase [Nitrososphaerota archaeon]